MVTNIDNKTNLIRKTIKLVVDPPPPSVVAKSNTGGTEHYFSPADYHALVNFQQTNNGPLVRLSGNRMIYPQLVGHPPLDIPPTVTETYVFQPYKIPNYYLLIICVMMYSNQLKHFF